VTKPLNNAAEELGKGALTLFEELGPLGNVLVLLASLVALGRASDWAITNAIKVAETTGVGKTTVGFILVASSTSLPELSWRIQELERNG